MRNKGLVLTIVSAFVLVFALAFASATLTFSNVVVPTSANDISGTFQITFDLTNNDIFTSLSWTPSTLTSIAMPTGGNGNPVVSFNVASIADGSVTPVTVPVIATITYTNNYGGPTSQIDLTTNVIYTSSSGPGQGATNNPAAVPIFDTTKPVISITGSNPAYIALSGTYTDAGATATDNYDSTIAITSVSNINTAVAGTYTVTYTAQDSSANQATAKTRTVVVYSNFCAAGSSDSDLALSVDIKNKGNGEDDEWHPLDTIEIEVEFDNNKVSSSGLYDLNDVTFELGVFNSAGQNVAGDMIWISEDEEKFEFGDVDEGDDAKHVFEFRVNPAEFSSDGNYKVKIKAYPSGQESTYCIAQSADFTSFGVSKYDADISINLPSDDEAVVVDEETLPLPAVAQCEDEVAFSANIWNIGDRDFEDQIMITLYNSELGISENKTITGDLDQGELTQVAFTFKVPAGVSEKIYNLDMKTYYDWDSDNSEYDEVSKNTFIFPLTVSGNCIPPALTISASLESGGKAGESLVVKSTIKNTGDEETVYTFAVSGYSDWASNAKVNNTLTLNAGQSGDIWITLDVDKKASGDQTFNIEASSEGKLLKTQPVQVGIEGKQGFNLSDSDSLVAILIALISAIVIAIIIVLIVKASRK
ncbi:MAG: putative S-layer protein [Nanoarchaeota archaeon]